MLGLLAAAGIMAVLIAVACCKRSGDFPNRRKPGNRSRLLDDSGNSVCNR